VNREIEIERERVRRQDYGNSDYNQRFVLSFILILLSFWSFLHTSFVICAFYSGGRTDCVCERGSGDGTKQGDVGGAARCECYHATASSCGIAVSSISLAQKGVVVQLMFNKADEVGLVFFGVAGKPLLCMKCIQFMLE
jgi:hypothetical protein